MRCNTRLTPRIWIWYVSTSNLVVNKVHPPQPAFYSPQSRDRALCMYPLRQGAPSNEFWLRYHLDLSWDMISGISLWPARQRTRSFDCSLRATNVSPKEDPIKGERKFLDLERRRLGVCGDLKPRAWSLGLEGREEKRYRVGLFGRVRTAPTALDTTCVRSRSTTSWILLYSELVHSTVDDTSHVRIVMLHNWPSIGIRHCWAFWWWEKELQLNAASHQSLFRFVSSWLYVCRPSSARWSQ